MKANELRIGNYGQLWHFWGKQWTDILQLTGKHICWLSENKTDFKPIPLTEENIVNMLGFKLGSSDMYQAYYHFGDIGITYRGAGGYFEFDFTYNAASIPHPKKRAVLKYVHQLQNLYFAVTGEELEIKNNNKSSNVPE